MGLSVAYRKLQLEMLGGSGCGPVPGTADGWFVARTSVRDVGGSLGILAFATFLRTSSFRFWLPSPLRQIVRSCFMRTPGGDLEMDGDVGAPQKERKSCLRADFAQLAAQVLARKVR